jgi:hypothetical protein
MFSLLVFTALSALMLWTEWRLHQSGSRALAWGLDMPKLFAIPTVLSSTLFLALFLFSSRSATASPQKESAAVGEQTTPFTAQVVGIAWMNPLQRRDYPTEWQLLWTLGLVGPNKNDEMVKSNPKLFSKINAVSSIAAGYKGTTDFDFYHVQYIDELMFRFHDNYFSDEKYFYNAHSLKDRSTWRELAGIRIEYALPSARLETQKAWDYLKETIISTFSIGNTDMPTLWSKATPPTVRVTTGGANAGFTSLTAALNYLQSNPGETVWAMSWDAPSRPLDEQINENLVLLVLAGPSYKTDRKALAWIGLPDKRAVTEFKAVKGLPAPEVQAWRAVFDSAAQNGNKKVSDIGYVIHDANNAHPHSSARIGPLAQTLTTELPGFDFLKQTFNTPALLGEMGAGSALTNVALAIAYANHMGKNVLVAGTTDPDHKTAVLVSPPAEVRPIDPDKPWFRARSGAHAYLPWWGLRHDAKTTTQGYSK